MKSIRTKILAVVLTAVLITTVMLLSISIVSINLLNNNDSNLLLEYIGKENATTINRSLDSLEQAVNSVYYYAAEQVRGHLTDLEKDAEWRKDYLDRVEDMALSEASNAANVEVVYYRLDQRFRNPSGFLYQYYEGTGKLERRLLTDISMYDPSDMEHVGWYYLPQEAGEALWIGPYDNYNLKMRMMSFEAPVYDGEEFVGIVGMDIDISALNRELSKIRLYTTGSAMLFDQQDNLIYHKNHTRGLSREKFSDEQVEILEAARTSKESGEPVEYGAGHTKLYATELQNGMVLCVIAPLEEINAVQRTVLRYSMLASVILLAVVALLVVLLINRFLAPLKELTAAAKQLSEGQMDVEIHHFTQQDEIGQLAGTFEVMANSLKHYFDHFHSLAYTDNLTGLNNKAAFQMTRDVIESEVKMGRASFAIIVMDLNNLKVINDSIGHEMGDKLLVNAAACMRRSFIGFPLYRIGGDEFCSIIKDSTSADELIARLQANTAEQSEKDFELFHVHYQVAAGSARYDKEHDSSFQEVFQRADQAMYENKKMLKAKARAAGETVGRD